MRWTPLMLVAMAVVIVSSGPIAASFYFVERGYNEGWNVYHAARVESGGILYDENLWRIVNYPPVSFYLLAYVNVLFGNLLLAGRVVASFSLIIIAWCVYGICRYFKAGTLESVFAAVLAIGFFRCIALENFGTADTQTLAHALSMLGFLAYLTFSKRDRGLVVSAFLLALALFTKHNILAAPMAISLDLMLTSQRKFLIWAASAILFSVIFLIITLSVAGENFIPYLLSPREYTIDHIWSVLNPTVYQFQLVFYVVAMWFVITVDPKLDFGHSGRLLPGLNGQSQAKHRFVLGAYGMASLVTTILFAGGLGVSDNICLELGVFLAICVGVIVNDFRQAYGHTVRGKIMLMVTMLSLGTPIFLVVPAALNNLPSRSTLSRNEAVFLKEAAWLADQPGDIICQSMLLCYFSGHELAIDPFNVNQLIRAGRIDGNRLVQRIENHDFAVIQMYAPVEIDATGQLRNVNVQEQFSAAFYQNLMKYYHVCHRSPNGWVFYVPT